MDKGNQSKIIQNLDFIASNICSFPRLLNLLLQESVLNQLEVETIECMQPKYSAGTELGKLICKKDNKLFPVFVSCLHESGNEAIAQRLINGTKTKDFSQLEPIWFGVTVPTTFYIGRDEEMKSLEKSWNNCLTKKILSIVAVTGLGGVGKSELAKNFAEWFYENVGGHCIWIEAQNSQTLVESFQNLAEQKLKISLKDDLGKEKTILDIVSEVYEKLFGQKVLLIFDNIENYGREELKLLFRLSSKKPPTVLKPFVITTSRLSEAKKYFGAHCSHLDLQVLTKNSAIEFFYKSFSLNESPGDILNELIHILSERLQFFPLAMQQASAYINQKLTFSADLQHAISNYLTQLETHCKSMLSHDLPQYDALEIIPNTTFVTWKITLEKLREESGGVAVDIMNIVSFLSPDNIPTSIVIKILQNMEIVSDLVNVDVFFDLIRKYSMINYSGEKRISVHRLVQEVIRVELEERKEFNLILSRIAILMTDMLKAEEMPHKEVAHVQSVWFHLSRDKEMVEEHGELLWWICHYLHNSGKYRDIFLFSSESGDFLESALGMNNRLALQMKHWKGVALRELGEYLESLEVLKYVHGMLKDIFGPDVEDYLFTTNELGGTYWRLQKYEEALETFKEALEKIKQFSGNEHPSTLALKNNIAIVLREQNKLVEAMEIYEQVLEVKERVLGTGHPDSLSTKHNIACIKLEQKDYSGALKEFKEVLEIQEKILEFNHPHSLRTKYQIAATFCYLGRFEESLQLANEVYQNRVQIIGPRHPDTTATKELVDKVEMEIALLKSVTDLEIN